MDGTEQPRGDWANLAKVVPSTPKQKGNTLSLQLQVSVTVFCIFCFAYSRLSVIDELCARRFHFILLAIQLDEGAVTVLESRRKEATEYKNMIEMLQK